MLVLKIILLCLNLMEGNIWFILPFICRSCQDMSFSFPLQNPFNPFNNLKRQRQALYQAFLPSFPLLSLMCALQANSLWQCFEILSGFYTTMWCMLATEVSSGWKRYREEARRSWAWGSLLVIIWGSGEQFNIALKDTNAHSHTKLFHKS